MSEDQRIEQNIRRSVSLQALKRIRRIVDEENADDAFKARMLRGLMRYGWLALLIVAVLFARYLGVV